ncbi:carbohydrate esterase family 1 protein [Hypoxylon argillaceum]|nr:carbohydrate esterase family 1 protein [Hypoxylon argillaceum]
MYHWVPVLLGLSALCVEASVKVRKTGKGPTGYEVDFKYTNKTANRVRIGGGITPLTDQLHSILGYSVRYDPHDYKPGDFYVNNAGIDADYEWPYEMTTDGDGVWKYSTPLPSGIYSYAYVVDCDFVMNCSIDTGQLVIDQDLPPFQNVQGDQVSSNFQVPFDPKFQASDIDTNFDYALDAPKGHRGTIKSVNYTSPGSIHPAPDVHHFGLYLPAEYGKVQGKKYPLLYLSHGVGGNGNDWENLGRMSAIMDNLILGKHIPPTVVVMPSFYNLDDTLPRFIYGNRSNQAPAPTVQHIRENYQAYLFPWVEENLAVCDEPSCRAFAGLSWGGRLTHEMYVNATDYFSHFGMFSPATDPPYISSETVRNRPELAEKGIFVAYGLYDSVFSRARDLESALHLSGVEFLSRVTPFGSHYWNTWQDNLWWYGVKALWKDAPFSAKSGR